MNEELLSMLINSYGLVYLLEECDLEPVKALEFLIEEGLVDENKLRDLYD